MQGIRKDVIHNGVIPYGWKVNYIANHYSRVVNNKLKTQYETTRQEFVVLFSLVNSSNITAQDICEVTGRPKNTIRRAINSLIRKNCITKSPHPTDARSEIVEITPQGRRLYDTIIPLFEKREQAMLAGLSPNERKTLMRLLDKMIDSFNAWTKAG